VPFDFEEAVRSEETSNITRILLWVVVIGMLLAGSFLTLLAFLSGLIWATTITVATRPALIRLERAMGGRRSLAVAMIATPVVSGTQVAQHARETAMIDVFCADSDGWVRSGDHSLS
jgi:hypothetical protein